MRGLYNYIIIDLFEEDADAGNRYIIIIIIIGSTILLVGAFNSGGSAVECKDPVAKVLMNTY